MLKKLGLTEEEARRNVLQLSGGQKQRAAIARTLVSDAPVMLMSQQEIWTKIQLLKSQVF